MTDKINNLGGFEEMVLLAICGLGKDAYGVTIREALAGANRKVSIGALYTTLGRLENKGYVTSYQGESTAERGGKSKKFFELTGTGVRALDTARASREHLRSFRLGGGLAWNQ